MSAKNNVSYYEFEMKFCRSVHYIIKFPNKLSKSKRDELIRKFYELIKDEEYADYIEYDYFPSEINYKHKNNIEDDCLLEFKKDKNGEYCLFSEDELMN